MCPLMAKPIQLCASRSGVPLRALMAALTACLAARDAFPAEAAASALGQLLHRPSLPPLFMRFVMQARALHWMCMTTEQVEAARLMHM